MHEIITDSTLKEYEEFIGSHPKGHFIQSSLWGKVKDNWKWEAVAVRDKNGAIKGTLSVLIRRLPAVNYTLMYGGRGPVCDVHDEETMKELIEGVRALAKKHRSYTLKLDPDILSDDAEFLSIMDKLGFCRHKGGKNFEGIQPRYVFRLNIENKNEDEVFSLFHQKTRYNIRLAERKGVEVRLCGKEMLGDFSRIMLDTGVRDGFVTRPKAYFEKMLDVLGEHARL
ncbi:MAG: peptidoglycan bridge formation glycyltransferase FemA/FemB family protein [Bacillota bacterium]|nr:peptidoglycan bridge formation glycyltransferase FemA/FemB family protein [Bacillota bacterium]